MSVRETLLTALDSRTAKPVSGERLADQLTISRVAIWKHVQALRDLGIPIQSRGRSGYQLWPPFDPSLLDYSKKRQGSIVPHYFLHTRTTQWLAKEGGIAGLPEGHVWLAEIQSQGRGRLERPWDSRYGGLWFSLLLRPRLPATRVPPLTLVAGLSLRNAIAKVCGINPVLKWPNDVLIGSRKVAGILTEMSGQIDRTDWVIIGVGINVNNEISAGLKRRAIALISQTKTPIQRAEILKVFLKEFLTAYQTFQKQGFGPFQQRYWSHYGRAGQVVRIQTAQGPIVGKAIGIDAHGAILIESRRKIHAISEGEITQ